VASLIVVVVIIVVVVVYCQDGTTEWINTAEDSPDAVQLAERIVTHKSYPALQIRVNQRARAMLNNVKVPANCKAFLLSCIILICCFSFDRP
jgi:hypothetical protein